MRLFIKTMKNIMFEIQVKPEYKVYDAKKMIETMQHEDIYPAPEQKLIYHGQVLKNETTFKENNIAEDSSIIIMHSEGCNGISVIDLLYTTYVSHKVLEPEKQLGSITIKADDIIYDLYREEKIDMSKPSIGYMDLIPVRGIGPICSELKLEFDLFCGAYKGFIKLGPEDFRHMDGLIKRSIRAVDSGSGEISALFGYLDNATIATLEVQLLNMSASPTINVYGVIASTNSHFDMSSSTNILFLQKPTHSIQVCSTEKEHVGVIPLSKSYVSVPLGSVMYVDFSLFCDGEGYQGTACFDALIDGTDSQEVAGRFLVKVTWSCNEIPILE